MESERAEAMIADLLHMRTMIDTFLAEIRKELMESIDRHQKELEKKKRELQEG